VGRHPAHRGHGPRGGASDRADLETASLSLRAELATNYVELRCAGVGGVFATELESALPLTILL